MSSFDSRRVSGLKRRRDVAGLIDALQTGNERDRRAAANALVTIPDPRAVDPLIEALSADDWLVRTNAALALGEFQDSRPDSELRRIVAPLNSALGDQQPSVRAAAASALGRLRDPASVEPLVATLDDDNAAVGKTAALVLRGFDDDRARAALAARSTG
jgi:HEAT repeat-containing taxis protein